MSAVVRPLNHCVIIYIVQFVLGAPSDDRVNFDSSLRQHMFQGPLKSKAAQLSVMSVIQLAVRSNTNERGAWGQLRQSSRRS